MAEMQMREVKLSEAVKFLNGKSIKAQDAGVYPVYGANGQIGYADEARYDHGIIIGRVGAYCGAIQYSSEPFWPSDNTIVAQALSGQHERFWSYVLSFMELNRYAGGAAQPLVTQTVLKGLEIIIPEYPVQERIANILKAYDDLIENNQRRIRILEEMAQSLYREWFVHFRYPGHEKVSLTDSPLGLIPEGWKVKVFTDIADVLSGGTPKKNNPEFWSGTIPFFTPKDSPNGIYCINTGDAITEKGLAKCNSQLYPMNTVFITARGTVGKICMPIEPMAMNQSCYALWGKEGYEQRFIFYCINSKIEYLKKNTGGATFDTIIVDTFRRMQIIVPEKSIIQQYVELISPIIEQIGVLTLANDKLSKMRDLLLPKLISGEIEISDVNMPKEDAA